MDEQQIASLLFSGEYDHLTVAEFAARFPREDVEPPITADSRPGWRALGVRVVDGVATLPDGRKVRSSAEMIVVPLLADNT